MISGRIIKTNKDLEEVNRFLTANSIKTITILNENNFIYILEADDKIIGVCSIDKQSTNGILKFIVISKELRGQKLGDGLLRATFNYCLRNGINEVYYHKKDSFLVSIGFTAIKSNTVPKVVKEKTQSDEILHCNLEDFFSRGCKHKGRD